MGISEEMGSKQLDSVIADRQAVSQAVEKLRSEGVSQQRIDYLQSIASTIENDFAQVAQEYSRIDDRLHEATEPSVTQITVSPIETLLEQAHGVEAENFQAEKRDPLKPLKELEKKDKIGLLRSRIKSIIKLLARGVAHPIRTYYALEKDLLIHNPSAFTLEELNPDTFVNKITVREGLDLMNQHKVDFATLLQRVQRLGLDQYGGTVVWMLGGGRDTSSEMVAQDVFLRIAALTEDEMRLVESFFKKYTFLGRNFTSVDKIARIQESIDFVVSNPVLSEEQTLSLEKIQRIHDVFSLSQFKDKVSDLFLPEELFGTNYLGDIVADSQKIDEQLRLIEVILGSRDKIGTTIDGGLGVNNMLHNLMRMDPSFRKKIIDVLDHGVEPSQLLIKYLKDSFDRSLIRNDHNEAIEQIQFASRLNELVDTDPESKTYFTAISQALGKDGKFLQQFENQQLALLALKDQLRTKFLIASTRKLADGFGNLLSTESGDISQMLILAPDHLRSQSENSGSSQLLRVDIRSILSAVEKNEIPSAELGQYLTQVNTIKASFNTLNLQPIHNQVLEFLILHHAASPPYLENGRFSDRFVQHFPDFVSLIGMKPRAPDYLSLISVFTPETCPPAYAQLLNFFVGSSPAVLATSLREVLSGDEVVSDSFMQFWSTEKTMLDKICFFLDRGGSLTKFVAPHIDELRAANTSPDLFWNFVFAENNLFNLEPEIQFLYTQRSKISTYLTEHGFTSQFYSDFYLHTRDGDKGARIADKRQLEDFGVLGDEKDRARDAAILRHLSLADARFWSSVANSYKYSSTNAVDFLIANKEEIQMTYDGDGMATQLTMVLLARQNILEAQEHHVSRSLSPTVSKEDQSFWNTWLSLSKPAKSYFNTELISRRGTVDDALLKRIQWLQHLLNERVPGKSIIVRDLADFESILDAEGKFNQLGLAKILHQKGELTATKDIVERANREDWRAFLGEALYNRFLQELPVQTDEARNAFTHNGYDRTSELIEFLTQQCVSDFALDREHMSVLIEYIARFGLSRSAFAIHYFFSLRRVELGALKELPEDIRQSEIKTSDEMLVRIDALNSRLYSHDPMLPQDLEALSKFDAAMLGIATGRDKHRFMNRRNITQLLADFVADYEGGKITPLNDAFKPIHTEVQKSEILFDYESVSTQYNELKSEILNSLAETNSIDPEKDILTRLLTAKRTELIDIVSKTDEPKKKFILEQINRLNANAQAFSGISDSEGLLTFIASYKWSNAERSVANSVFRRLLFKQLLRSHHSPQYIQDLQSALSSEASFTAVNYMVNFVNDLVKHHLLNSSEKNREKYWTDAFFNSINQGKMKDFMGGLFTAAGDLQRTVATSESVALQQVEEVDMIPDRGLIGELSGYLADVCYTGVEHLLADWPVTPYKFIQKQQDEHGRVAEIFIGSVLVFQVADQANNPCLLIRAFNIPEEEKHPCRDLITSFIDGLKEVGKKIGAKRIIAAGTSGTISNYPIATSYFQTTYGGEQNKVQLAEPFTFNGYDITDKCVLVADI